MGGRKARPLLPRLGGALFLLVLAGCAASPPAAYEPASAAGDPDPLGAPPIRREFRGVWVATVSNIDWPSERGLPVERQRAELLDILDRAAELNLNAVIFQVRPAADALYASELEPWSEYLTGESGRAPDPLWDPLEFAVREAHARGLELHAWFNPYRARHPSARSDVPADHIARTDSALVWRYGTHLWMDPGEPAVQDRTTEVVMDVVRRYDIDGVHLDDYFYPYRERDADGAEIPFPDDASYARYRAAGGTLDREDWRRENVDTLIERLYREIEAEKPWVKFGISPFGVWRPGYPSDIGGFDAYSQLYADARKWLRNGWVDYFTPQLYWQIARPDVSYPVLLGWWLEQNVEDRHIWPGNFSSRWSPEEILGQVLVTRGMPGATGNVHFSMRGLMPGRDSLPDLLVSSAYSEPALVPASPWLGDAVPDTPKVALHDRDGGTVLAMDPAPGAAPWLWAIRTMEEGGWRTQIVSGALRQIGVSPGVQAAVVNAIGRTGLESAPAVARARMAAGASEPN